MTWLCLRSITKNKSDYLRSRMRCDGRSGKRHHGGDLMQWLRIAVLLGRIEKSQRRNGALVKIELLDWREKKKQVVATKIMMLLSTI